MVRWRPFLHAMAHKGWIIAAGVLALLGCSAVEPELPTLPEPDADTCNVRQYAGLIGQDVTALERVLILGQVRVIRPGTVVTQDFRPERMNFHITADDHIQRIACG